MPEYEGQIVIKLRDINLKYEFEKVRDFLRKNRLIKSKTYEETLKYLIRKFWNEWKYSLSYGNE